MSEDLLEKASRDLGSVIGRMYRIAVAAAVEEGMDEEQAKQIIAPIVGIQFTRAIMGPPVIGMDPERTFLDWLIQKSDDQERPCASL